MMIDAIDEPMSTASSARVRWGGDGVARHRDDAATEAGWIWRHRTTTGTGTTTT